MRFIDLFGGIGGFSLGMEMQGHKCVWYNDIDKYATACYNKRFGTNYAPTDIKTIDAKTIPDFDCICGGFPCQSFSIAGKRMGFDDTRGTLFFEIARIARERKPAYLFLENVKGLLSHDNGRTFEAIIKTLDEIGYDVEWQVLNSKWFGVPQNRERVFIIGHSRERRTRQVFPFQQVCEGDYRTFDETQRGGERICGTIDRNYAKGGGSRTMIVELTGSRSQSHRVYSDEGISKTLGSQGGGGSGKTAIISTNDRIRLLTPTECERLQGFPNGHTEGFSDTQRYKMLGNAVTVNVIEEIARRLEVVKE